MEVENNDDNQKLVTDYIPKLGIEFDFEQEAYEFIMSVEEILDLVFEKNGAIKEKRMVWWLQESLLVVKREIKPHGREMVKISMNGLKQG